MLLAIFFVNVWGVLQLVALGSFARTVRVRTVLAAIGVGLFFCAPFAVLLEHTWATAIAALTDRPIEAVIAVTGYTVDPPIEEIIRILPLALLLIVPVIRRQLSVTDCVLIGAAAGAGFGLAEDLYRFGAAPQHATAVPGGWVAPYRSPIVASASQTVFIPSMATAMGGWLPDMGGVRLFGLSAYMLPNLLLIWSALAGLAVGLWLRFEGAKRWYVPVALLAYASGAHAANNADYTFGRQLLVTAPFRAISDLQPVMPIAALAIAWWFDRRRHGDILPEHLLAAEQGASSRAVGTWRACTARMPESIFWVGRFVRVRRAFNTERFLGGPDAANLRMALQAVRNLLDHELQRPGSGWAAVRAWKDNARRVLRRPATIVWIVLTLPSSLWFVVGGWPETAGVQRVLSGGAGWGLAVALTVAAHAWMAFLVFFALRSWRTLLRIPIGDPGAALALGVMGGTGALGFGTFGLLRVSTPAATGIAHIRDAIASLLAPLLPPLANLGPALWNSLFKPSPRDLQIPVPGTGGKYFTPTGVRRAAYNNLVDKMLDAMKHGHNLDPSGTARYLDRQHAYDIDRAPLKMNVGTGDPNDISEIVGNAAFIAADYVFGLALAEGLMSGRGSAGGTVPPTSAVNPLGKTEPAIPTSGVNTFGRTEPALPTTGVNPFGRTEPALPSSGVNPLAETEAASPTSPLATTRSPLASTNPALGTGDPSGGQLGSADTQPAPVPRTPRIDDP